MGGEIYVTTSWRQGSVGVDSHPTRHHHPPFVFAFVSPPPFLQGHRKSPPISHVETSRSLAFRRTDSHLIAPGPPSRTASPATPTPDPPLDRQLTPSPHADTRPPRVHRPSVRRMPPFRARISDAQAKPPPRAPFSTDVNTPSSRATCSKHLHERPGIGVRPRARRPQRRKPYIKLSPTSSPDWRLL